MKSFEKMFFLTGLPRTGSTLLSAILSQNPDILTEGLSGLLQLMLYNLEANQNLPGFTEALDNTNRQEHFKTMISEIPHIYYKNTPSKIIIDKQRGWINPYNTNIAKTYIESKPKFIVMVRPIKEIIESFYYLAIKNDKMNWFKEIMEPNKPPFRNSVDGFKKAINQRVEDFIIISYKNLTEMPEETIKQLYEFLEIPYFEHDFSKITNKYQEGDYGIGGLHEVRKEISIRNKNVELPEEYEILAEYLQKDLEIALKKAGVEDVF